MYLVSKTTLKVLINSLVNDQLLINCLTLLLKIKIILIKNSAKEFEKTLSEKRFFSVIKTTSKLT